MFTPASPAYLRSQGTRGRLMRLDTGSILKRFFFCEEALIRGLAGWLAGVAAHDIKMLLPRFVWENALAANELRQRVFELRYPSRLMEIGDDAPLVSIFEEARHAPSAGAFLVAVSSVLIPALRDAYAAYLAVADDLGDGPSRRFLEVALREKERQSAQLVPLVDAMLREYPAQRGTAEAWRDAIAARMSAVGGAGLDAPAPVEVAPLPGRKPFALVQVPARDPRFHLGRFYWPDNVDPNYPYGEGIRLQLRSAVSHLNEVWAVENAGAILGAFAGDLGWEFVVDAARWLYDESRHAMMGWRRLCDWGFTPDLLPVGSYLYESTRDQDPIYRLGMLHFFETKNIGKKPKRAATFGSFGDTISQHDMDFDWADEGIHAAYGKHWLTRLIEVRQEPPGAIERIHDRCGELVESTVASATVEEVADVQAAAERLVARAQALAWHSSSA